MSKDFYNNLNDAYERFAKDKAEVEALKAQLSEKEESLERFREDILLNMMHDNTIKETKTPPKSPFTFIDGTPDPDELGESKSIVIHYNPEIDGVSGDEDSVFVSYEYVDDLSVVPVALAYALVKSMIYYAKSDRTESDAKVIGGLMDKIDVTSITDKLMRTASGEIIGRSLEDVLASVIYKCLNEEEA